MIRSRSLSLLVLWIIFISENGISSQLVERICTTARFEQECVQLQRGNSEVVCQRVQDSIECAQRMRNNTADFGIFSAESALQLANLQWDGITVIKELRHRDRVHSSVDFESVVIVRSSHRNGREGLQGLNFCHPGLFYDRSQRWSEGILKHFERTVVPRDCDRDGTSPAEIEASALARFFNSSCRPGKWSNNIQEDAQLKKRFPQLCSLCNSDSGSCNYIHNAPGTGPASPHIQALNCLTNGGGHVAYVSLEEARNYFEGEFSGIAQNYAYLCQNGSMQTITDNARPCSWLRQPWKVIISRNERAISLARRINLWMDTVSAGTWQESIREIIGADSYVVRDISSLQNPRNYILPIREVPVGIALCSTQSTWCTTSPEEKDKCDVVRAGGITVGVYPVIECRAPTTSAVSCINDISNQRADFMGIDSNFGYLARFPYNLTAALYAETETEKYSSVVVVVRANSTFERFENLRNTRACFPEFGGIASIAFINTGKNRGFFSRHECNFGKLLGDFFGSSCVPGSRDELHDPNGNSPQSLCESCRTSITPAILKDADDIDSPGDVVINVPEDAPADFPEDAPADVPEATEEDQEIIERRIRIEATRGSCEADVTNRYYGNRGALMCLNEIGDVAVLELQNLATHARELLLNPNNFRIMCRNGSLADRTGFNVDEDCALTTIVDGEVVTRRNDPKSPGIINALMSFDKIFLNDPDFKMYNIFSSERHLLFKDSTIGLVSQNETNLSNSVQNYIRLFENVENCIDGDSAASLTINIFMTISLVLVALLRMN